jgi:hypothetical protein
MKPLSSTGRVVTTEFDDLTAKLKDALEARYRAGYEAALHELVGHIADKLGLRPEPKASAPKVGVSIAVEELQADVPEEEWQKLPTDMAASNGPTNLPNLQKHLQRAYERLQASPGITSREAREQWGGSSNVLYQLHKAGLAEKDGSKFYAVER